MMRSVVFWALFISLIISFFCANLVVCQTPHKITSLPGLFQSINFTQYAGYITVDASHGRNLFYWFVQSQHDPVNDPVLLWLNGGPGASSLLGFFTENGPFRPDPDGESLHLDPYRWNRVANMIYLECPAGVGFSYSNNISDYTTDDEKTAADNYQFLLGWFKQFPQFKGNDFYLTGESYGGHYIPELANLILEGNMNNNPFINMKGFAIGNPGTEDDWYYNIDEYAFVTFMYEHGLIPQQAYTLAVGHCGWNQFLTNCSNNYTRPAKKCNDATRKAIHYLPVKHMDLFDIYAPICLEPPTAKYLDMSQYVRQWPESSIIKRIATETGGLGFDPCIGNYMQTYLNMPQVQKAIGVIPTQWSPFGNINYTNPLEGMIPYYIKFLSTPGLDWRILIYSGDADSAVPFVGSQRWISCLQQSLVKDWSNWYFESQVAGSYIEYDGITFLTIKGAGHMVPWYAPGPAYTFFERWIQGKPF